MGRDEVTGGSRWVPAPGREFRTKGKRPVFGAGNLDEHTGSPLLKNSVYRVAMKKV